MVKSKITSSVPQEKFKEFIGMNHMKKRCICLGLRFDVCAAVLKDCKPGKRKGCSQQKVLYTMPSQPLKISLKMNQSLYYSESPQGACLMIELCVCTS